MSDCIFCKIIAGEIPSTKVYEDDMTYAFRDINPMAPVHVLVVPKCHVSSLQDNVPAEVLAACLKTCTEVAKLEGLSGKGYRVITNIGDDGCQSVKHLHFHVLGGRKLPETLA